MLCSHSMNNNWKRNISKKPNRWKTFIFSHKKKIVRRSLAWRIKVHVPILKWQCAIVCFICILVLFRLMKLPLLMYDMCITKRRWFLYGIMKLLTNLAVFLCAFDTKHFFSLFLVLTWRYLLYVYGTVDEIFYCYYRHW